MKQATEAVFTAAQYYAPIYTINDRLYNFAASNMSPVSLQLGPIPDSFRRFFCPIPSYGSEAIS